MRSASYALAMASDEGARRVLATLPRDYARRVRRAMRLAPNETEARRMVAVAAFLHRSGLSS